MPELDILHGFEHITQRTIKQWVSKHRTPFQARLQIFPRAFATGTKTKAYTTCTVDDSPHFTYTSELEPIPPDYQPSVYDLKRASGKPFARYLKPLHAGELHVKVRGKEIVFAAGYHAMRVHFGLEGTILIVPTASYEQMVLHDCPGSSTDKQKAGKMRSFIVPSELTVPNARNLPRGPQQSIAMFAALVGEEDTIIVVDHNRLTRLHLMSLNRPWLSADLQNKSEMWSCLWSSNHGPDWIDEPVVAGAVLDVWRTIILSSDAELERGNLTSPECLDVNYGFRQKVKRATSILSAVTSTQEVFNGYGQHTAMDLFHSLALWPGMPPCKLCIDESLYSALRQGLADYAAQYVDIKFQKRCLSLPNCMAALAFNNKSDTNYANQYLQVYRKCSVKIDAALYNKYVKLGLFDKAHMIGQPYDYAEEELCTTRFKRNVPVFEYKDGSITMYTVIVAQRPAHWVGTSVMPAVPSDVRNAGFATTIGPASFYPQKQNQHDWREVEIKRGRVAKERTGKRGRPAKKQPNRKVLQHRAKHGAQVVHAALNQLREWHTEDSHSSERAPKRQRVGRGLDLPKSDRLTRSVRRAMEE